jgi:hypothetical protein
MLRLALLFRQGFVGEPELPFSLQACSIHQTTSKIYLCWCLIVKCLMDALLMAKAQGVPLVPAVLHGDWHNLSPTPPPM